MVTSKSLVSRLGDVRLALTMLSTVDSSCIQHGILSPCGWQQANMLVLAEHKVARLTPAVQHSDRSTYPGLRIYSCAGMQASTLVLAEHKDARLAPATLSTVTAATQLGAPVTLLVSGHGLDAVVQNARGVHGVGQVLPVSRTFGRSAIQLSGMVYVSLASS